MLEKLTVQMTKETLFDFLLYHTYSRFSGFLSNVLGLAVAFMGIMMTVMGKVTWLHLVFYLAAAAIFLAYTPLQLLYRAKSRCRKTRSTKTLVSIFSLKGESACFKMIRKNNMSGKRYKKQL